MDSWQDIGAPVEEWDRGTRLRNRLTKLTGGERAIAVAVVALVVVGLLVALVSVQLRFGLLELFNQIPGLLFGGTLVVVGLVGAALLFLRLDRHA